MSDPRDDHPSDDRLHGEWLRHSVRREKPGASGTLRGSSLRDRTHGLRDRQAAPQRPTPAPTLDSVRARSHRAIVAPKAPSETPGISRAPVKVGPQRVAPAEAEPTSGRLPALRPGAVKLPSPPHITLRRPSFDLSSLHRPTLHRPQWRLSRRQTAALAVALLAILATVSSLALLVPGKPVVNPGTGAVNAVTFKTAANPPTGTFNFGPYFAATSGRLLMMGSDGTRSVVWGTSDGSNWERLTSEDAFDAANRRFVVLGFSDDGNGGYVAVGDSFTSDSKVSASAWYSRDGGRWFAAGIDYPESAQMMGLAVRPGAMVAAGNGVAWVSQDGSSWTMVALPGATGYVPRAVRTWGLGFAIVSVWGGEGERKSAVWVSPDGKTWVQAWTPLTLFDVEDAVAYGGGLVAVGSQTRSEAEMATPTPKPTPAPSGKVKVTPKPTKTAVPTPVPSGSAAASGEASPTPVPTATPITFQSAGSWSSPNGLQWYRGAGLGGPYAKSMASVTQAFDSLVAVGAEPGGIPGLKTTSTGTLTLWISDNGTNWKPIETNVSPLARARLVQYGSSVVLAGVATDGSLAVLTGEVALGAPLPQVASTPTPAIALSLRAGSSPPVPGGKADDVLGPVVGTRDRFYAFITRKDGTGVWTSTDGRSWSQQAKPADLMAEGAKGTPYVLDAMPDGKGGIVAVGKIAASGGDSAMIWRLSGGSWTRATIAGSAPSALGSVAVRDGTFVAAASVADGTRLMASEDGVTWVQAGISGATGYLLKVTPYAGGFVASGRATGSSSEDKEDASATPGPTSAAVRVWTSDDGLAWTVQTDWDLPRNPGFVIGAGDGLVITSTGITGKNSWWWSADGKAWNEAQLTTVPGGCMASLDAGLITVNPPAAGSTEPAWTIWVSEDGRSWQNAHVDNVSFGMTSVCRVASAGQKTVVVGWEEAGVLKVFYSK